MSKFIKGYSYIVRAGKLWYVVHQTGQRSWRASVFTHVVTEEWQQQNAVIEGDSEKLYAKLKKIDTQHRDYDGAFPVQHFDETVEMRKAMFNVLKHGRFEE